MTMQKKSKSKQNGAAAQGGDVPVIAWDKLDIMTSIEIAEIGDTVNEMQLLGEALAQGLATPEMVERLVTLRSPEMQKQRLMAQMDVYAKYVTYVPDDWFVEDVVKPIRFDDPGTYKYLRSRRFGELYQMLAYGAALAEATTGN